MKYFNNLYDILLEMKTNNITLRYKICSIKSPLDTEIENYSNLIQTIKKSAAEAKNSFRSRTDDYLSYDQSLLADYEATLQTATTLLPPETIKENDKSGLLLKLLRTNQVLKNLQVLLSNLNEHESEKNILDTLQLAPEERTWYQTLLSVFWSSNKRHDYFKIRNKQLSSLTNQLNDLLVKSIKGNINNDYKFELYQTEDCSLEANSMRHFWYKLSSGYHYFLELIKIAKVRDNIDIEFDNPEGKIYASISVRAGIVKEEDLTTIRYPDNDAVTAKQLINKLIENNILSKDRRLLVDPFDDSVVQTVLTPVLNNLGFNPTEVIEALRNSFMVNINIEQQANLAMAFSSVGRQMTQQHPQHAYSFFHNRFEQLKTIPANRIYSPTTITEANLMDTMPTINETNADKFMVTFGKVSERSFMNVNKEHYVTQHSSAPNRRRYTLESERRQLINAELSARIFQKLEEDGFINELGRMNNNDLFKFRSSNKRKLIEVLKDIKIINGEHTLSRAQRRQVLAILKKASETKFSENATIQFTKLATNEHTLNDFTIFLIEDGDKKWVLFPYDHFGNPSYNLKKLPSNYDFQKALKEFPHKLGLPKGIYYTFFQNQLQVISKHSNTHDLSLLYRKITSNPYFLRTLALLTISGFLIPHDTLFNMLDQGEELGIGFSIYLWFKASRGIAATNILRKQVENCERKLSSIRYGLSMFSASLYLLMYALPKSSMMLIGDSYWNLFIPLIVLDMLDSLVRWPLNNEKIQRSMPEYPKHVLFGYIAIIGTILSSIWLPDHILTNDTIKTMIVAMEAMRVGTYLRRDIPKANRSLEERYTHKFESSTAVASIGMHVGTTALLLYALDKLLDYLHATYYMLP